MPEREAALRRTLEDLHSELEGSEPIDAELRAELEQALAEIQLRLGRTPRGEAALAPSERLEALALRFERTHPLVTQAIGGVVRALAAMGI